MGMGALALDRIRPSGRSLAGGVGAPRETPGFEDSSITNNPCRRSCLSMP